MISDVEKMNDKDNIFWNENNWRESMEQILHVVEPSMALPNDCFVLLPLCFILHHPQFIYLLWSLGSISGIIEQWFQISGTHPPLFGYVLVPFISQNTVCCNLPQTKGRWRDWVHLPSIKCVCFYSLFWSVAYVLLIYFISFILWKAVGNN